VSREAIIQNSPQLSLQTKHASDSRMTRLTTLCTESAALAVCMAAWTCPGKIVALRMATARLWNDMLNVECGALQ